MTAPQMNWEEIEALAAGDSPTDTDREIDWRAIETLAEGKARAVRARSVRLQHAPQKDRPHRAARRTRRTRRAARAAPPGSDPPGPPELLDTRAVRR